MTSKVGQIASANTFGEQHLPATPSCAPTSGPAPGHPNAPLPQGLPSLPQGLLPQGLQTDLPLRLTTLLGKEAASPTLQMTSGPQGAGSVATQGGSGGRDHVPDGGGLGPANL